MQKYALLKEVGKAGKPVILKKRMCAVDRGAGSGKVLVRILGFYFIKFDCMKL